MSGRTLYDKLWDEHAVQTAEDGTTLLYIDCQLVHEVTSPQAFEGLRLAGRAPWRPDSIVAVADHNVPTEPDLEEIPDAVSRHQVEVLDANCAEYGLLEFPMGDPRQGIVHVIGPEQGITLPGMTVVCGDSHTSTHGALATLAFGIGTSQVEHVLATQCLPVRKPANMLVRLEGCAAPGVGAKDLALALIGSVGAAGGTGCAIEFAGQAVEAMSMEARMTLCNMAIEAGARSGLVAVDDRHPRIRSRANLRARRRRLGRGRTAVARTALGRRCRVRACRGAAGRRVGSPGDLGHVAGDGRAGRCGRAPPRGG